MKNILYRNIMLTVLLSCFGTSSYLCANGGMQTEGFQKLNEIMKAQEEVMLEKAKAQAYRILQERHASSIRSASWFSMRKMCKAGIILGVGGYVGYVLWKNWRPFRNFISGLHNRTRGAIQGWLGVRALEQGHTDLKKGQESLKGDLSKEHNQIFERLATIASHTELIPKLLQSVREINMPSQKVT
ncbi:hypothetical protein E3J79_03220 [Candidatus Dependentiae bacterium]|nr:MAG: hypothetical protein E3J79_03220 [Candidatus Dependentiae bacterium]